MITYKKHTLDNGLRLIIHEDESTPMAAVNLLYDVGARDETADKTGFAHLFEHLMFGGSTNIADFDAELQLAGGTSNAFTSSDITNYYNLLPAQNLETALWLESDRMLNLHFSQQALDVEKKVVSEEFKQYFLNQPYGDAWHNVLKMCYKTHPYGWPVIGKNLEHISNFVIDDVIAFFNKHYCPNNAILAIAGGVKAEKVLELVKKWFGNISPNDKLKRELPFEAPQTAKRNSTIKAEVPLNALYMTFGTPVRNVAEFYGVDFISDILSGGQSSRLHQSLVKKQQLFNQIGAYITANIEPGLLLIEGKLNDGVTLEVAEKAVWDEIEKLKTDAVEEEEMIKVKHKIEAHIEFNQNKILNRAMDLCYFELLDEIELINTEVEKYQQVDATTVKQLANTYLKASKSSVLHYYANNV